jgi:chromosome partitioning protein
LFDPATRGVEAYTSLWHWLEKKFKQLESTAPSPVPLMASKAGAVS